MPRIARGSFETRRQALVRRAGYGPHHAVLWERLKGRALLWKFRQSAPVFNRVVDYWCPSLHLAVLEDGRQDLSEVKAWLDGLGVTVIEIPRLENQTAVDTALEIIKEAIAASQS